MKFTSLILVFVTLATTGCTLAIPTTSTLPEHLTNAERLRMGLPLNPPHRRSPTLTARDSTTSPDVEKAGRLFVLTNSASTSGYISSTLDSKGRYVVTSDTSKALRVTFKNHALMLDKEKEKEKNGPRFGATFGESYQTPPGVNAFEGNSYNFAVMTGTAGGSYGEKPHKGDTSYKTAPNNFIESAIFTLGSNTNEILPTWINPDGTPRPSQFILLSTVDGNKPLYISAGVTQFTSRFGGIAVRVFLV